MKSVFYIAYFDYEKVFDYANRAIIINKLMKNECGCTFTNDIAEMYKSTTYMTNNKLLDEIVTWYCVAQSRHTSSNQYSFFASDTPLYTNKLIGEDFMDQLMGEDFRD